MTDAQMNKLRAKVGLPPVEPYILYNIKCEQAADALTKEKCQEFMDCILDKCMTLGQAQLACEISFEAALGIMNRQIKSVYHLERQVA